MMTGSPSCRYRAAWAGQLVVRINDQGMLDPTFSGDGNAIKYVTELHEIRFGSI